MTFSSIGLSEPLVRTVTRIGYETPTPIQRQAVPAVLRGEDVWASAQTGSGKTAAYLLPLLQTLSERVPRAPRPVRALVLAPTRELAAQIQEAARRYGRDLPTPLKTVLAVGGASINPQMMALRGGADLVIATPGRVLDLVEQNGLRLASVQTFVLDEADRLLSLGFSEELTRILALLPRRRQNLLFSATFPASVQALAAELLHEPTRVRAEGEDAAAMPREIVQRALLVDTDKRTLLLRHLLETHAWPRVLVFVASRHVADHLTVKLTRVGIAAAALHGDLSQTARRGALEDLGSGKVQVLVGTDLAARGLDLAELPAVVNYDLPRSTVDYLHRVGRTGRAGHPGLALSFVTVDSAAHFALIERRHQLTLPRETVAGFEPTEEPRPVLDAAGGVKGKRKSKKDKLREEAATREQD